jgi:hypothetical protein
LLAAPDSIPQSVSAADACDLLIGIQQNIRIVSGNKKRLTYGTNRTT